MRQKQREIRDRSILSAMLDQMEILHLALHDEPFPYVVPLNFGYEWTEDELIFYFHCAREGKKTDLLMANPHVAVNVSDFISYAGNPVRGHLHDYRSVTALGTAHLLSHEEHDVFLRAHMLLLEHNHRTLQPGDEAVMRHIAMWAVHCPCTQVWGKAEIGPHSPDEVPFYTGPGDGLPLDESHILS